MVRAPVFTSLEGLGRADGVLTSLFSRSFVGSQLGKGR